METKETTLDRAAIVDQNFIESLNNKKFPVAKSKTNIQESGLSSAQAIDIFQSQIESRHLDFIARILRKQDQAFYTIGSSGHEGNAAVAVAFDKHDMALLHYRSCAFMLQRARQHGGDSRLYDHLLSLVASKADPISAGRHKVFGSFDLNVPPQTSTIASQLPKAVGAAFSSSLAPSQTVVLCSFGDASVNHSTAQGAFNSAQWISYQHIPLPLVFLCEDNGIGVSVLTPQGWIEMIYSSRPGLSYIKCDGLNFCDVYKATQQAAQLARTQKTPVFLHMQTVRLLGHAGSDIEFHYRTKEEINQIESDDPLLHSARILIDEKILTATEILARYEATRATIALLAERAITEPKLSNSAEIMASIIPPKKDNAAKPLGSKKSLEEFKTMTMAQAINNCLADLLGEYPKLVLFGEDVGKKGGVYRVTADLQAKFGKRRVFDTMLDEQTILGTALGLAQNGFIPVPEIQFLAYVYNALDQIRGEAATLSFFSSGQFTNPMVIRIAGLAYQKGFGGHFHNDNGFASLREIPGVIIACPSHGIAADGLLRECVRLAAQEQRVVIFLEPIALYHVKDSYNYSAVPADEYAFGKIGIEQSGNDYVILSYGNGAYLSRKALKILSTDHNINGTLVDLRWLAPLNIQEIINSIKDFNKILIVDESRRTGGVSESIIARLNDELEILPKIQRITAEDSFIPLGNAWQYIMPSVEQIVQEVLSFK
jgi:2-oxoisovalerate dehydrogenase E1 component